MITEAEALIIPRGAIPALRPSPWLIQGCVQGGAQCKNEVSQGSWWDPVLTAIPHREIRD